MVTAAQREQRKAAGKSSGKVRAGHKDDSGPTEGDPSAPMPHSSDPEVDAMLAAYTRLAGKPMSWPDVKNCEQVRSEIYRTQAAARDAAIGRGKLMTREQVEERDERVTACLRSGLLTIQQLLVAHVPPDRLQAAMRASQAWTEGVLNSTADAVERFD